MTEQEIRDLIRRNSGDLTVGDALVGSIRAWADPEAHARGFDERQCMVAIRELLAIHDEQTAD